jgi:hypothetical protein
MNVKFVEYSRLYFLSHVLLVAVSNVSITFAATSRGLYQFSGAYVKSCFFFCGTQ